MMARNNKSLFIIFVISVGAAVQAAPSVLEQMPTDAQLVLTTKPLAELNAKLDLLAHQLGLMPAEQPLDLIQWLSANVDIPNLDPSRGIGLAVIDLLDAENNTVFYLPVQNAQTAMESLKTSVQAKPLVDDQSILEIPGSGVSVKASGNYLIASENSNLTSKAAQMPKGVRLDDASKKIFDTSECAIFMNVKPAFGQMKESLIPAMRQGMAMAATQNPSAAAPQVPELSFKIMEMMLDRASEIDFHTIGLQLAQEGITILSHSPAQPGSKLAVLLNNPANGSVADLKQLPSDSICLAMSMDMNPKTLETINNDFFAAIEANPVMTTQISADELTGLKQAASSMTCGKLVAAQYADNNPAAQAGPLPNLMYVLHHNNAIEFIDVLQETTPLISKFMASLGSPIQLTYSSKTGSIEGKPLDQVTVDMSQLPLPPMQKQAMAAQFGGKMAFSYYLYRVDIHQVVLAMDQAIIEKFIQFAKSDLPGLDQYEDIAATAMHLPEKANTYMFFHPGNFVRSMLSQPGMDPTLMMMFGAFAQLPGTIGSGITMNDGQIDSQTYIPNEFIQSVVNMYMQMQMQMQQAPPPGMYGPSSGDNSGQSGADAPPF